LGTTVAMARDDRRRFRGTGEQAFDVAQAQIGEEARMLAIVGIANRLGIALAGKVGPFQELKPGRAKLADRKAVKRAPVLEALAAGHAASAHERIELGSGNGRRR